MAVRRPLVRVNGRSRQLPDGDTLAGVVQRLPVYQAGSSIAAVLIDLTVKSDGAALPVYQASGNVVEVPL